MTICGAGGIVCAHLCADHGHSLALRRIHLQNRAAKDTVLPDSTFSGI